MTISPGHVRLTAHDDLAEVERDWRAFEATAICTPFQTFTWISTWQRHVGARIGTKPAVVVGRETDGRILFILPLAIERVGPLRKLTWLASDLCDYNAPLLADGFSERVDAERFVALWGQALELLQRDGRFRFDLVELTKMPGWIGTERNPFLALPVLANASAAHIANLGTDWEQYYAAKRSGSTRKKERRQLKHMAEFGEIKFAHVEDEGALQSTLTTLIEQKQLSFARMGVENLFARPGYPEFYRDIVRDRALIDVSRLDVGGEIAATSLGLTFRGCFYLVLSSYTDDEVSKYGPGRAHLHELLAHTIKLGLKQFDFTIGDEPYKRDWSDIEMPIYDFVATAGLRGLPLAGAIFAYRRAKRFIKKTPVLWSAYSKARALAGAFTGRGNAKNDAD